METQARSLAKSLSWRAIATLTTIALVWGFTGQVRIAVPVGGVEVLALAPLHSRSEARDFSHLLSRSSPLSTFSAPGT